MNEFMYGINTAVIAGLLFASMAVAVEAGYRTGLRRHASTGADARAHISSIQASILGILALMLGFTFSLALQRYDTRSEAVVDEANAIGTAYLRTQILPAAVRRDAQATLREYLDVRVQASLAILPDRATRSALSAKAAQLQGVLWEQARRAVELEPNPATSGLYLQAVNEVFDRQGKREAALERHVPEAVLLLLYATFLMAGASIGLASGVAGHRPSFTSYIMVALVVVLVFIILDLDRPRRGLIEVSQASLLDLQAAMRGEAGRR